jgi:glycosyltransferase involved in cell wall biosynthesis
MSDSFRSIPLPPAPADVERLPAAVHRYEPDGAAVPELAGAEPEGLAPESLAPQLAQIEAVLGDIRRHTSAPPAGETIRVCLAMIVRNEAAVIARCLQAVRPLVDEWVIVDTGSTDKTAELVGRELLDLPGELFERPWRDFASNRNEAIELAEARGPDYVLVVDADDLIVFGERFARPSRLGASDVYDVAIDYGTHSYQRTQLFRAGAGCRYEGKVHELLVVPPSLTHGVLEDVRIVVTNDGARSADPQKFARDAQVLAGQLAETPGEPRTLFYLAQSYRDAGERELALAAYERRAAVEAGFVEERYVSLFERAGLLAALGRPDEQVIAAYLAAYEFRPCRAEPLCELATFLRKRERTVAAYPFARAACDIALPATERLWVDRSVYEWRAADELAICAYYAGHFREAFLAAQRAFSAPTLPEGYRDRIAKNMAFARVQMR